MTAPDMVEVVAGVLAAHQSQIESDEGDQWSPPEEAYSCSCGQEHGGWVASGADWEWPDWTKDHAAHQARAVLDALAEAGTVEWGVQGKTFVDEGWDHVWTKGFDGQPLTKDSAKNHLWLKSPAPFRLVSRLVLPWVAE